MKSSNIKIQSWDAARQNVQSWKNQGLEVVFTNGCFDLLHYGHIQYLREAAQCGDKLVIGLNSDTSIAKLKGTHRPINDQKSRTHILAAFEFVDIVVVFEQDTPYDLINLLKPDVLVKGGDWKPEQIVGSELVLDNGGRVLSLSFADGYSTTNLETKILENNKMK